MHGFTSLLSHWNLTLKEAAQGTKNPRSYLFQPLQRQDFPTTFLLRIFHTNQACFWVMSITFHPHTFIYFCHGKRSIPQVWDDVRVQSSQLQCEAVDALFFACSHKQNITTNAGQLHWTHTRYASLFIQK